MQLQLEELAYQTTAIQSVVAIFNGTNRNAFDNATTEGIRANVSDLSVEERSENVKGVIAENGIREETARLTDEPEYCIEMETGTGKTLVYIKTIYELHKHYGFTKFIILVPTVPIRQGTLSSFKAFSKQLEAIYGFQPDYFEYDSKRLNKVTKFVEDQHPQVMIMTLASFNSEDKILNQAQREDLFANIPFIEAIARTRPIILMDEPQEGMDTDNSVKQIARLNPLAKIRYSATHKVFKNLLYRLTPYDSYQQGLVKKIEVLTVAEKNDEASLKLELSAIQTGKGAPKVKLKAWKLVGGVFKFAETNWLSENDNIGAKTANPSYNDYTIKRIYKSLKDQKFKVEFTNGVELVEKQQAGNRHHVWKLQLEWFIRRHFQKTAQLAPQGIKCLSLVFIDRVANYMGDDPTIKNLFVEQYKVVYAEFKGTPPTDEHIEALQGYYFAKATGGDFTDREDSMTKNREIFDLILRKKDELLTLSNPVQFIFSHSALGVGWDNPNVFNIATLNESYSDIKKRQEIGRGLRICVNQDGKRVYDLPTAPDDERVNRLTVVPNETYESFVGQYQEQIKEVYGSVGAAPVVQHTHKGVAKNSVTFRRNPTVAEAFQQFWDKLSRKTDYVVVFDEETLIQRAIEQINAINLPAAVIEVSSQTVQSLTETGVETSDGGSEVYHARVQFSPLDLVEELSENTGLGYQTLFRIVQGLTCEAEVVKNPPRFVQEAARRIRHEELDALFRKLSYRLTDETFPFDFDDFVKIIDDNRVVDTPKRGVFDKMVVDSATVERPFALGADNDPNVVCFLKLPDYYVIKTPIGDYNPDWGVVMKRKSLHNGQETDFYFVIETKGTNDLADRKALTESERYKIQCAIEHFKALGIDVHYEAPVKEYTTFQQRAAQKTNPIHS